MKVLFDHQMFSIQKYGGISRYFANLYHHLQGAEDMQAEVSVLYSKNHYLANERFALPKPAGKFLLKKDSKQYRWNKRYSRYIIRKNNFDLFHPTYYHPYFLPHIRKPFVVTVHDMIYELFPEFFLAKDIYIPAKRKVVEAASHVIAISESTKRDVQRLFKVPDEKITVIHHGFSAVEFEEGFSYQPPFANYILFVGDRAAYKNFSRFIVAVAPLLHQDATLNIICTGGGTFEAGEFELFHRNDIAERVLQVSASDQQLKVLYQQARVFVFPSLYEGFGFPLLEAFANDCPTVASNTSCFEEVAGKGALYFDPYNPADIKQKVQEVIYNENIQKQLVAEGKKRLELFTIEACVEATVDVYRKVLGK